MNKVEEKQVFRNIDFPISGNGCVDVLNGLLAVLHSQDLSIEQAVIALEYTKGIYDPDLNQ